MSDEQHVFSYRNIVAALFVLLAMAFSIAMYLVGLLSPTVAIVTPIGCVVGLRRGSRMQIRPEGIAVGQRKVTPWMDVTVKTNRMGHSLMLGTGLFKGRCTLRYYDRNWRQGPLASVLDEHIPADAAQLRSALGFGDRTTAAAPPGYVHFAAPLPEQRVM